MISLVGNVSGFGEHRAEDWKMLNLCSEVNKSWNTYGMKGLNALFLGGKGIAAGIMVPFRFNMNGVADLIMGKTQKSDIEDGG